MTSVKSEVPSATYADSTMSRASSAIDPVTRGYT